MKKIGIIGAGNIGSAIAKGLILSKKYGPSDILVSRRRNDLLTDLEEAGFEVSENNELVAACDIVLLAVLPGQAEEVVRQIAPGMKNTEKILVSVVSAVTMEELTSWCGDGIRVVRVMPNTAAEYGASMTCIAGKDEKAVDEVKSVFDPLGQTMVNE